MRGTDLYIVAAGNGSRLQAHLPKALVPILEEPCLTTTLKFVAHQFRKVFVVTSVLMQQAWSGFFQELNVRAPEIAKLVINLPIQSGLGDGHATLEGLLSAERVERSSVADDVVIMWGDVFLPSGDLIHGLLTRCYDGAGLVPAVNEDDPYVCLLVDQQMRCIAADFSKYGEKHSRGLHDQSVFRFRRMQLLGCLRDLHHCLWKHNHYVTAGGELSLLYTLHKLYNAGNAVHVYETEYSARSFNTAAEVESIRKEMQALRWGAARRDPSPSLSG